METRQNDQNEADILFGFRVNYELCAAKQLIHSEHDESFIYKLHLVADFRNKRLSVPASDDNDQALEIHTNKTENWVVQQIDDGEHERQPSEQTDTQVDQYLFATPFQIVRLHQLPILADLLLVAFKERLDHYGPCVIRSDNKREDD